jgi:ComF family protein
MMDFKYHNKGYLGEKLGDILYDRISLENLEIDVIIAVPVSRERLKKRGYNQSELMARRLGARMNVPVDSKSLVRKMNTRLLRTMNPAEREIALKGAFGISSKVNVERKRILLIDDIYTTGATADACSKVLKEAGALEVLVLSLASGGNRKPEEN